MIKRLMISWSIWSVLLRLIVISLLAFALIEQSIGYLLFAFILRVAMSQFFGLLVFGRQSLLIASDLMISRWRYQDGLRVTYSDIKSIRYVHKDCNSNGKTFVNTRRSTDALPYLELVLSDSTTKRILLMNYNFSQWQRIHRYLLSFNDRIIIINTPQNLIDKSKYF